MLDDLAFSSSSSGHTPKGKDMDQVKRHQLLSRTIAILAGVASSTHQLAIQAHITQSGFSILSERVEFWSLETDQDFLQEFLRDEEERIMWMHRLTGAKIYVMVLERHDAAETWLRLCGPDLEGSEMVLGDDGLPLNKMGLRARYGAGVLYGSSVKSAPRQLAICFPDLASVAALDALHAEVDAPTMSSNGSVIVTGDDSIASVSDAHGGKVLGSRIDQTVSLRSSVAATKPDDTSFKARPMPSSTKQPTIKPRLSKAAALRMGVAIEPPKRRMSTASSSDASLGISGLPRADVALPKSLMAPSIAPRLNRTASVRTKTTPETEAIPTGKTRKPIDFSNTPGHKRVSLSSSRPACLAAPVVAPRLNKAASARLSGVNGQEAGKVSLHATTVSAATLVAPRKQIDFSNTPGHKRLSMTTSSIKSLQAPTLAPRTNVATKARTSVVSSDAVKPDITFPKGRGDSGKENEARKPIDFSNTPGHKRPSGNFAISSLGQPTIVPRSNAAATKRLSVGGVPPTTFPGVPIKQQSQLTRRASVNSSQAPAIRPLRPSSRSSMSSGYQNNSSHARTTVRSNAPPSSFRM